MSHAVASPHPPASARPRTAATTGTRSRRMSTNNSIRLRASSRLSLIEPSEIFCKADRSAPEQKSAPAPLMTTARTPSSPSAARSASFRPEMSASFKALRFSGRFRVTRATAPSTA